MLPNKENADLRALLRRKKTSKEQAAQWHWSRSFEQRLLDIVTDNNEHRNSRAACWASSNNVYTFRVEIIAQQNVRLEMPCWLFWGYGTSQLHLLEDSHPTKLIFFSLAAITRSRDPSMHLAIIVLRDIRNAIGMEVRRRREVRLGGETEGVSNQVAVIELMIMMEEKWSWMTGREGGIQYCNQPTTRNLPSPTSASTPVRSLFALRSTTSTISPSQHISSPARRSPRPSACSPS